MENLNELKLKQAEELQNEKKNSCDDASLRIDLQNRIAELEQQLSKQEESLRNAKNYSRMLESEINDINNKAFVVQRTNTELKKKLSEMYAMNSQGDSPEVCKIRPEMKEELVSLYKEWLEYESSDVSSERYQFLQSVIKRIFLYLEKSGMDFKSIKE